MSIYASPRSLHGHGDFRSLSNAPSPLKKRNLGILVDAACDLPTELLSKYGVTILPLNVFYGDQLFVDTRDLQQTLHFYSAMRGRKSKAFRSEPLSIQQVTQFLEESVVSEYDDILAILTNSNQSGIHEHVFKTVKANAARFRKGRQHSNLPEKFHFRVVDSTTLFSGQGLLVYHALRLALKSTLRTDDLVRQLAVMKKSIRAFVVPKDLYTLSRRSRHQKNADSGWLQFKLGQSLNVKPVIQCHQGKTALYTRVLGYHKAIQRLLEMAKTEIDRGLKTSAVVMSYAGELNQLGCRESIMDFCEFSRQRGVQALLSVMSPSAALLVGPGAFSLAIAVD